MERYRIIRGEGYNGCIPTIIYWVQVRKDKRLSYEWVNVKGFDTLKRAKELLNILIDDKSKGKWFLSLQKEFQTCGFMSYETLPAYTLQDILDKLLTLIIISSDFYKICIEPSCGYWDIYYYKSDATELISKKSENIIDVAYDMLCWCIENGYIKKEGE